MMPEIELRRFEFADQQAVRALVLAGLLEHWGVEPDPDAGWNADLDDIAGSYADGVTLVAVAASGESSTSAASPGRQIVGTGTIVPRSPDTAQIVRMSVDSAWRSRGIGALLVEALVALAADGDLGGELRRVVLETTADWHRTVAFYERCGFAITHHVDGAFGRDAWFERSVQLRHTGGE
jgi:GNAT superfamily N-acetyltransferase